MPEWPMTWGNAVAYCQAGKMRDRRGWQLWLGDDDWAAITDVRIRGDDVLITVDDGRTFRAGYVDAVRCRQPETPALIRAAPLPAIPAMRCLPGRCRAGIARGRSGPAYTPTCRPRR